MQASAIEISVVKPRAVAAIGVAWNMYHTIGADDKAFCGWSVTGS